MLFLQNENPPQSGIYVKGGSACIGRNEVWLTE